MKFKKTFASDLAATLCITSIPLSAINVLEYMNGLEAKWFRILRRIKE